MNFLIDKIVFQEDAYRPFVDHISQHAVRRGVSLPGGVCGGSPCLGGSPCQGVAGGSPCQGVSLPGGSPCQGGLFARGGLLGRGYPSVH